MSEYWAKRCDVFWTSHGCHLPRGHEPSDVHICAIVDEEDVLYPDSKIVRQDDRWVRWDYWTDAGWNEVGFADPFRMVDQPVRIVGVDDAISLKRVSFEAEPLPPSPKPSRLRRSINRLQGEKK